MYKVTGVKRDAEGVMRGSDILEIEASSEIEAGALFLSDRSPAWEVVSISKI